MQPSYALLLGTSYPKTIGEMCYAIIELTPIGLKQPLVTSQSQAGKLDILPQHAVGQSKAREVRYVIPAYSHDQSQVRKVRHAIPAYIVKYALYKRGCKSPKQQTS